MKYDLGFFILAREPLCTVSHLKLSIQKVLRFNTNSGVAPVTNLIGHYPSSSSQERELGFHTLLPEEQM